jgi:sec-independent protein translocase protein TatC
VSETQETFVSHLIELRTRVVHALVAFLIVFIAIFLYPGAGPIYDFLAAPLMQALPQGAKMIATGVVTPFLVPMKVTALVAFMVALPYILFQAWAFVAPGLYEHEKRLAAPVIVASTVLFLVGVAFCYYFVFGKVFAFINEFAPKSITPAPDIEAYFGFVITMFLAFGITFEIPIVVMVLVRFGVVSLERLRDARPYVIVGAFVVSAIITPPDVLSQFLLAVPMCLLYLGLVAPGVP